MTVALIVAATTIALIGLYVAERAFGRAVVLPARVMLDPARLVAAEHALFLAERTHPHLDALCAEVAQALDYPMVWCNVALAIDIQAVGTEGVPEQHRRARHRDSLCARVVARAEPLIIDGANLVAMAFGGCFPGLVVSSYIGVPLFLQGQPVGALAVADRRGAHRTRDPQQVVRDLEPWARRIERQLGAGDLT